MKQCSSCKTNKSLLEFAQDRSKSSGLRSQCRICTRACQNRYVARNKIKRSVYHKKYRALNKDTLDNKERYRRLTKRAQGLIAHARIRAKRLGIPYALDDQVESIQAIIDIGVCEMTALRFDLTPGQRRHLSPSLDRKIPALGYVPGNVRVICYGMNAALGNWGEAALIEMMDAWRKKTQ